MSSVEVDIPDAKGIIIIDDHVLSMCPAILTEEISSGSLKGSLKVRLLEARGSFFRAGDEVIVKITEWKKS